MKMKRAWALAAAVVLSMSLALGTTLAYLTDTDHAVNVMTLGNVDIEQHEYERVQNADGSYEMITLNGSYQSYKIKPFTQNKPLYPAVGDTNGGYSSDYVYFAQLGAGASGGQAVRKNINNVQDKFVLVENTGNSDAFVRTLIAFEIGSATGALVDEGAGIEDLLIMPCFGPYWNYSDVGEVAIDGNNYHVIECVYKGYEGGGGYAPHHAGGILPPGEYTYNNLAQVYMTPHATNEDVEALDGNNSGTYEILVLSQAVQAMGFEDQGAVAALNAGFGESTAENVAKWFGDMTPVYAVSSSEELKDALSKDQKSIYINLAADMTYDVAAWANDAMGGDTTEDIIINGNGHTITFNQTNSDWNNIVTKNGAKLTIENANITNAGKNDGPWNRHDLNFACDVELKNVKSDKAMAFKAGAKLTNVTINDANDSDTYAIWIQPNGQTVELNGVTIDMLECTGGRGIKIDEQYVDAPAKVTLKVADTTFKTVKKSAIIVKSKAGADIILNNVNIEEVADDTINPVWVDEASEAYADLVTVTGGTKIVEGK